LATALAIVSAPAIARSDTELAGDLDIILPLTNSKRRGLGISARLGYGSTLGPVVLTPEASMGFYSGVLRLIGGARFGLEGIVRPGIFFHVGPAFRAIETTGDYTGPDFSGLYLTYDAGAFVDVALTPNFRLGAHGALNTLHGRESPERWATAGIETTWAF